MWSQKPRRHSPCVPRGRHFPLQLCLKGGMFNNMCAPIKTKLLKDLIWINIVLMTKEVMCPWNTAKAIRVSSCCCFASYGSVWTGAGALHASHQHIIHFVQLLLSGCSSSHCRAGAPLVSAISDYTDGPVRPTGRISLALLSPPLYSKHPPLAQSWGTLSTSRTRASPSPFYPKPYWLQGAEPQAKSALAKYEAPRHSEELFTMKTVLPVSSCIARCYRNSFENGCILDLRPHHRFCLRSLCCPSLQQVLSLDGTALPICFFKEYWLWKDLTLRGLMMITCTGTGKPAGLHCIQHRARDGGGAM